MRAWVNNAVVVGLSISMIGLSATAQDVCWRSIEVDAARVRNMQSMLMVAALECSRSGLGQDRLYDEFIRNNRGALIGFNDSLKLHYLRGFGPVDGRSAYDHFTTALANRHAGRASAHEDFCRGSETLVRLALKAEAADLVALASDVEERPFGVGATCDETALAVRAPAAADWLRDPAPDRNYAEAKADFDTGGVAPQPTIANRSETAGAGRPDLEDDRADFGTQPLAHADDPEVAVATTRFTAAPVAVAVSETSAPPVADAPSANLPIREGLAPPTKAVLIDREPTGDTKAVAVAMAPGRSSPAVALAAAAQALQAAAEALRASASEPPADAAPVIRERVRPTRKL